MGPISHLGVGSARLTRVRASDGREETAAPTADIDRMMLVGQR